MSTLDGIKWRLEQDQEWLEELSENALQLGAMGFPACRVSTIGGLLGAYEEALRDRSRVISHFLEDPDSYMNPPEFLDSLGALPSPIIRVTSELGMIARASLPPDSDVFWADRGASVDEHEWCASFAFGDDRLALRPGDALRLYNETIVADVMFSSIDRHFHPEYVDTVSKWIGMQLLEFY